MNSIEIPVSDLIEYISLKAKHNRISLENICKKAGVSSRSFRRWKTGKDLPRGQNLKNVFDTLLKEVDDRK